MGIEDFSINPSDWELPAGGRWKLKEIGMIGGPRGTATDAAFRHWSGGGEAGLNSDKECLSIAYWSSTRPPYLARPPARARRAFH